MNRNGLNVRTYVVRVSDLELICRQCKGDINLKLQTSESARKINTQGNIQLKLQTSNSTL